MKYEWREIVEIDKKYLINVVWIDGEVKKYLDVNNQEDLKKYV